MAVEGAIDATVALQERPETEDSASTDASNATSISNTQNNIAIDSHDKRRLIPSRHSGQPMGPPKHSRSETLLDTLNTLQCEERDLYQRIYQLLCPPPPPNIYLPSTIAHTQRNLNLTPEAKEFVLQQSKALVKEHISRLTQYNEIRDIGLGLIGIVADMRRERVRDVQEEFGVTDGD
jgi:hypothetical protein